MGGGHLGQLELDGEAELRQCVHQAGVRRARSVRVGVVVSQHGHTQSLRALVGNTN